MVSVTEYLTPEGESPFAVWFDSIETNAALRVRRALARIENGNFGDSKGVGQGVMEYRLTYGAGYRLYYGRDGDEVVVLLIGGTKKRQSNDIKKAQRFWMDYKDRKGGQ